MGRRVFVGAAALVQLGIWLLTRPFSESGDSGALTTWLVGEALTAVVVGAVAAPDGRAARAVMAGWGLQMLHYAVVAPKGEEDNLWAVGLVLQSFFAAGALLLALLTYAVARAVRSRTGASRTR